MTTGSTLVFLMKLQKQKADVPIQVENIVAHCSFIEMKLWWMFDCKYDQTLNLVY